jgi:uncharacterized protein (TIRG00374 family)
MLSNDLSPTLTRHRPSRPFRRVRLVSHSQQFLSQDDTWKCDSVHNPGQSHVPPGNYTTVQVRISFPLSPVPTPVQQEKAAWRATTSLRMKVLWKTPAVKMIIGGMIGLMIGLVMLLLVSRFVDIPTTLAILRQRLVTPQGLLNAFLASLSFLAAFSIRGTRWKLFLRPITKVSALKAIQIYWVGIIINVLLPVQGGEVVKSLLLKRVAGVPVSRSLPTVTMDKALDLLPALVILAIVPFIPGIHMNPTLWLILALVNSILIGVIFVVGLTAWNRAIAMTCIERIVRLFPGKIGKKIEGFAMGFVDSLLAGASRPKTFLPAVLLTCAAITCDGLFAMFAFWTVGVYLNFGQAIFGYTIFNMFTILPTPPGQVGSSEIIGTLVFGGLLGFNKEGVLAMFVFSHPLTALIMATMCGLCLSSLGLHISSALRVLTSDEGVERAVLGKF